jgi:hypothetical protein
VAEVKKSALQQQSAERGWRDPTLVNSDENQHAFYQILRSQDDPENGSQPESATGAQSSTKKGKIKCVF